MTRLPRPILALVLLVLIAAAPTTQPGVGVVIPAGAGRETIQRKISDAWARGLPVTLDAGTYRIDRTLVIPAHLELHGNGDVTLLGTTANTPIIKLVGAGSTIDHLGFQASAPGVTAIVGGFDRTRIVGCLFWTSLARCIDGQGLITRVERCGFGMAGDVPDQPFQHIRIRGGGGTNNFFFIRDCDFYNAAGDDPAIDVGEGYKLVVTGSNIERNRSRVAVRVAGMATVRLIDNWLENNTGAAQVELTNDESNQIGNVVVAEGNWINLNGPGNRYVYSVDGASHVTARNESGTSMSGKPYANDPAGLTIDGPMHMVGWSKPDRP
jgi:hypothetical protein